MFNKGSDLNDFEFKTLDINPLIKTSIIYDAFDVFDIDNNGVVDLEEFKKLIKSLDETADDKKITDFMRTVDKDLNQEINIDEFHDMMMKYQFSNNLLITKHLQNIFDSYDRDGDGFISIKDLEDAGTEYDDKTQLLNSEDISLLMKFSKSLARQSNLREHESEGISKDEFMNLLLSIDFLQEIKKEDIETNFNLMRNNSINVSRNNSRSQTRKMMKDSNTISRNSSTNKNMEDRLFINK
jgi:Ca2+-binding EF-hand superfamily protein